MSEPQTIPEPGPVPTDNRLVNTQGLLEAVWAPKNRPTVRWLKQQYHDLRTIPYKKIGGGVWFDPVEVRAAIDKNCTIGARKK